MAVLIVDYSGWRGKGLTAPRRRAMIAALRDRGFKDLIFYGIPDAYEMVRWMGWSAVRVRARALTLGVGVKLGFKTSQDTKWSLITLIEQLAIKRLKRGDINLVYTTKRFGKLVGYCSMLNIPTIVEVATKPKTNWANKATRVVVLADDDKAELVRQGAPEEQVLSIYPLDASTYTSKPPAPCPDVPRFIYTAIFKRRKRLDMVLRAWTKRRSGVGELHIVGPLGKDGECLQTSYRSRPDIVFWGYRDVADLYQTIQGVGLMVSEREGLPKSMLEYMQHGFPVLVSSDSSKGFMHDGVGGRVLDPCNEEALRDAFDEILSDYHAFWKRGREGQNHLQSAMAKGEFAHQVADLVQALVR
jgi:glycosyltransferase involved in cell wall biosynthesis